MSTKYLPKHQWVKELGLKKSMAEMADSATDHLGHIINNAGPRDLVYLAAYASAVFIAYNMIAPVEAQFRNITQFWDRLRGAIETGVWVMPSQFDQYALMKAMIAGYMVLKIDASDITSAISKIGGLVATL